MVPRISLSSMVTILPKSIDVPADKFTWLSSEEIWSPLIRKSNTPVSEFALNVPELLNCDATVSAISTTGVPGPPPEPLLPPKPLMYCEAFAISIVPDSHVKVPSWFQVTDSNLSASLPISKGLTTLSSSVVGMTTTLSSPVVVKTKPPGAPVI